MTPAAGSDSRKALPFGDRIIAGRPWLPYLLLVLWYAFLQIPDQLAVRAYGPISFPLESLVIGKLLFAGPIIRPELAPTLAEPANASLIYPLGFSGLGALAGDVRHMFLILFIVQLAVPLLLYRLLSSAASRTIALLIAMFGAYFFVKTNWWTPEFIIQPLMIGAIMFLGIGNMPRANGRNALAAGCITGLILVLKHNVGIFFGILCTANFYIAAFCLAGSADVSQGIRRDRMAAYAILAGFFAFIPVFARKLLHLDEVVYYMLAYIIFWASFAVMLAIRSWRFDLKGFVTRCALFYVSALVLPALMFFWVGQTFGYAKYWHALIGMGFKYLAIWDLGIEHVISNTVSFHGAGEIYLSTVTSLLYLLPCAVALFVAITLALRLRAQPPTAGQDLFKEFGNGAVAIMAVFMLYPLESLHIAETKVFLSIFIALYFLRPLTLRAVTMIGAFLSIVLLPIAAYGAVKFLDVIRTPSAYGNANMRDAVGLPIEQPVAGMLQRQSDTITRITGGRPYYVVDSSGGSLIGLSAAAGNPARQYYIELRKGIFDPTVAQAVIAELRGTPFVVVNKADYDLFNANASPDGNMRTILTYVATHYEIAGTFDFAPGAPPHEFIVGFYVLKLRGG